MDPRSPCSLFFSLSLCSLLFVCAIVFLRKNIGRHNMDRYFGTGSIYRPGQREALDVLESGNDAIVVLPTAAGKSRIYQLFILGRREQDSSICCIIVCPLISLMMDQVHSINAALGINRMENRIHPRQPGDDDVATFLGSAQTNPSMERSVENGLYTFIFISPEKLQTCQSMLRRRNIALVVVDEAHCISEYGHDFRPDYRRIAIIRRGLPATSRMLALTATADAACVGDIATSLCMAPCHRIVRTSMNRPNITYHVWWKRGWPTDVVTIMAMLCDRNYKGGSTFIYVPTRMETERIADALRERGVDTVAAYHAGMTTIHRQEVLDAFRSGETHVLVATIAAGMGLNITTVHTVLHYGMSRSIASYMQESGRAGRSGTQSQAIMMVGPGDYATQMTLLDKHTDDTYKKTQTQALDVIHEYVSASTCRRSTLLLAMGERLGNSYSPCCDVCDRDATITLSRLCRIILTVAMQSSRGFGMKQLMNVLKGVRDAGTRRFTGGQLRHKTKKDIKHGIHALVDHHFVEHFRRDQIPLIRISAAGKAYLAEEKPVPVLANFDQFKYQASG